MVVIRQALTQDISGIATIMDNALGESADEIHISSVLLLPQHVAYVALENFDVIGFVSGFMTTLADGTPRWEIDLLGVHTNYRRRGLGRELIRACTQAGFDFGAKLGRGLVRVDNLPSQKAFRHSDYYPEPEMCGLYLSSEDIFDEEPIPPTAHLIPVSTFTYNGVWIEGEITPASLSAALSLKTRQKRHNAGAVVTISNGAANQALREAGFEFVGKFQWWQVNV